MSESSSQSTGSYTVVARRFRPQNFAELVGQSGVSKALQNAIATDRVGHAYLFTGARGVGKTSSARIFAKMLNCVSGPASTPCDECEICQSIAAGSDVDVLEIDGASNRGIDEIRQLRSNISVRPSRSRFKIYIIDEVHMLTGAAFNALLKTLEEPPTHVKFLFCTTDPEKIPITVLSRCQRFDFAPVNLDEIHARLLHILNVDGIEADDDAIRLIARRAAGSVRDSQSLLEQLIAFCESRITLDSVHELLGTVRGGRMMECLQAIEQRNPAQALSTLDAAILEGVDVGQMAEQLLGSLRDAMALVVGCNAEAALFTDAADAEWLIQFGNRIGLQTLLAMSQIIDQALSRMRYSTEPRILLEIALVRICSLENLSQLSDLIGKLDQIALPGPNNPKVAETTPAPDAMPSASQTQTTAHSSTKVEQTEASTTSSDDSAPASEVTRSAKKNAENEQTEPALVSEAHAKQAPGGFRDQSHAEAIWKQAVEMIEDTTAELAKNYSSIATSGPNSLAVTFDSTYNKEVCDRPERKTRIESALAELAGFTVRVEFKSRNIAPRPVAETKPARSSVQQRIRQIERDPFVASAIEQLEAEVEDVKLPAKPPESKPTRPK